MCNPGALGEIRNVLEPFGYTAAQLETLLKETVPHIICLVFNPGGSSTRMVALAGDVASRMISWESKPAEKPELQQEASRANAVSIVTQASRIVQLGYHFFLLLLLTTYYLLLLTTTCYLLLTTYY